MRLAILASAMIVLASGGLPAPAAAQQADPDEFGGLPPGPGQEEVYYTCQPCHSLRIVVQQGLSRDSWDETLVWMVEEQGMPDLEPEERDLILDYLAQHYGP